MNRLEKLKYVLSVEHQHDKKKSNESFRMGFDAASAEYEKIIAELEGAFQKIADFKTCNELYPGQHKYKSYEEGWRGVAEYAEKVLQKLKEFKQTKE